MTPDSNLEPTRVYSISELKALLGPSLAESIAPLAFTRGRYLGSVVIQYLEGLGRQKVQELLAGEHPVDLPPPAKPVKVNHGTQDGRENRARYHQAAKP